MIGFLIIQIFIFRTMFGFDLCSPNSGMTATGRRCHGTCHEDPQDDQGHYKCFVDSARTILEHCSPMASDLPADTVTHALEFSNEGKVCAGRCHNRDGTKMCDVVSWEWNEVRTVLRERLYLSLLLIVQTYICM